MLSLIWEAQVTTVSAAILQKRRILVEQQCSEKISLFCSSFRCLLKLNQNIPDRRRMLICIAAVNDNETFPTVPKASLSTLLMILFPSK